MPNDPSGNPPKPPEAPPLSGQLDHVIRHGKLRIAKDRVWLLRDVLLLSYSAGLFLAGTLDPASVPTERANGLCLRKTADYLSRVLDDRLADFSGGLWYQAIRDMPAQTPSGDMIDLAIPLRAALATPRGEQSFVDLQRVLAPILAGEITRDTLTA